jgi:hypothetical protein
MKNDSYISVNIQRCIDGNHKFKTTWSDKNPMKVSLLCRTCSDATGKSAYAAYGDDTKSFGPWTRQGRRGRIEEPEQIEEVEA